MTKLFEAIQKNDIEFVKKYIDYGGEIHSLISTEIEEPFGHVPMSRRSLLYFAAASGHKEMVKLAIKAGCCINDTLSFSYLLRNKDTDIIKLIISSPKQKFSLECIPFCILDSDTHIINLVLDKLIEQELFFIVEQEKKKYLQLALENGHFDIIDKIKSIPVKEDEDNPF